MRIEKWDILTSGKEKMSVVPSGYSNSVHDKLVGKQEVIYVCVQTTNNRFGQYTVDKKKVYSM